MKTYTFKKPVSDISTEFSRMNSAMAEIGPGPFTRKPQGFEELEGLAYLVHGLLNTNEVVLQGIKRGEENSVYVQVYATSKMSLRRGRVVRSLKHLLGREGYG